MRINVTETPMKNAMRIVLIVMLFALAMGSVASKKVDGATTTMHEFRSTAPALLVRTGDNATPSDADGDRKHCPATTGALSAFNDRSIETLPIHLASHAARGRNAAAAVCFSVLRP